MYNVWIMSQLEKMMSNDSLIVKISSKSILVDLGSKETENNSLLKIIFIKLGVKTWVFHKN
jgi:hypothetical protein